MNRFCVVLVSTLLLFLTFSAEARFVQSDSYQGKIQDPASLHKYTYAQGDPVNLIDPSGNIATSAELLEAMNIQGELSTAGTHVAYRVTLKKLGKKMACVAIQGMVEEIILQKLTGGIYIFEDSKASPSKPYIGSTKNYETRYRKHASEGVRKVERVLSQFHMKGSRNDLRLVEQFFMDILSENKVKTTNENKAIALQPKSVNSQNLRKTLKKLDFCK